MKTTKCSLQPCFKKFKITCLGTSPSIDDDTDLNSEMEASRISDSNPESTSVAEKIENIQLAPPSTFKNAKDSLSPKKPVRNKIFLKPGRSLMDWIRLGNSGKDLTGVGGRYLEVSEEELRKHNHPNDAWICIKGRVYNVTDYLEFHPGGAEELEKGIGKDGTKLFMEAHSWVNFETMLQKCIVGRYVPTQTSPLVENKSPTKIREQKYKQYLEKNPQITKSSAMHYDWYQSNDNVVIVVYTNVPELNEERVILDLMDQKELVITVYLKLVISYIHIELSFPVTSDTKVNIGSNGKIEIGLPKLRPTVWNSLGSHRSLHDCTKSIEEAELCYRPCKLVSRRCVTRNTYLLALELSDGSKMRVPVARHVSLKLRTNGTDCYRSYTPIPKSLLNQDENRKFAGKRLHFMIKVYADGALTPFIHKLPIGDTVDVSDHFGTFDISSIKNFTRLTLLAAGTGVTPMISIVNHVLLDEQSSVDVHLVFFNRTETDILWKENFDALAAKDKRFVITYVLSDPNPEWIGEKGRVTCDLLRRKLNQESEQYFCLCGPTAFNRDCVKFLGELGYSFDKQVHVFPND